MRGMGVDFWRRFDIMKISRRTLGECGGRKGKVK